MNKHLIIGYGNIGQRYASIFDNLNVKYDVYDIVGDFKRPKYKDYKSILICTPPDTHLDYIIGINKDCKGKMPIFCEKPLLDDSWVQQSDIKGLFEDYSGPSMVACNYRFSKDHMTKDIKYIEYGYPYINKYTYLDLIHFVDVCWERYGKPIWGYLKRRENLNHLTMLFAGNKFIDILGSNQSGIKYGLLNNFMVNTSKMYEDMLKHWLEVVSGRTESINPFLKAYERTMWLIELKNKENK